MALRPLHELHHRRHGRNLGLGIVLAAFIAIIFGLTIVKVKKAIRPDTADGRQRNSADGGTGRMNPTRKTRTVAGLGAVIVFMGAHGLGRDAALQLVLRVTGYGGMTGVAEQGSESVLDREITVRFDANTEADMPWEFEPVERSMTLKIGEDGLAYFEAYNPTDRAIAGQAGYNVAPFTAGSYFNKVQCFCFTEQVLQPGERVEMPVYFYVDPEIVNDRDAKYTKTITLSYTFYEIDLPEDAAKQAAVQDGVQEKTSVN